MAESAERQSPEGQLAQQAIAALEQLIAEGELRAGSKLPTQRQLVQRLDVAPGTVSRAVAELKGRGVLESFTGRGTYVAVGRERSRPPVIALEDRLQRAFASKRSRSTY
jgi:DNA-binding GntR family transcriptional regulator